jgi:hypothetical protein
MGPLGPSDKVGQRRRKMNPKFPSPLQMLKTTNIGSTSHRGNLSA